MTNKKIKNFERVEAGKLKIKNKIPISMRLDKETYETFHQVMKERGLSVGIIINEFMDRVNDLLIDKGSAEVCFIFEEVKKGGSKK